MVRRIRQRNIRGHGAQLRDEILSAATRVIDVAQNEHEVSLRSIAREAGITAPSVYAHFEDRTEILDAVTEASWTEVSAEISEHSSVGSTPRDRLLLGSQAYVSFAKRHPLRYALMTQVTNAPPAAKQVLDTVTRGLLACRLGAPETPRCVESGKITAALSAAIHGVAMLHLTDSRTIWLSNFSTVEVLGSLVDAAILQQDQASSVRLEQATGRLCAQHQDRVRVDAQLANENADQP